MRKPALTMRNRAAAPIKVPHIAAAIAPYADPASMYTGAPQVPTINTTLQKAPIYPVLLDVRDVPLTPGFDFRKRIYFGC